MWVNISYMDPMGMCCARRGRCHDLTTVFWVIVGWWLERLNQRRKEKEMDFSWRARDLHFVLDLIASNVGRFDIHHFLFLLGWVLDSLGIPFKRWASDNIIVSTSMVGSKQTIITCNLGVSNLRPPRSWRGWVPPKKRGDRPQRVGLSNHIFPKGNEGALLSTSVCRLHQRPSMRTNGFCVTKMFPWTLVSIFLIPWWLRWSVLENIIVLYWTWKCTFPKRKA